MNKITQQWAAALLATLCFATSAQAASVSTILDRSNLSDVLPNGGQYLEVTVSDGVDGAIDFNVQTLDALLNLNPGPAYGIQRFGMNFGSSSASIGDLLLPEGWTAVSPVDLEIDELAKNGFGVFDVILQTSNDNRADPLSFSIIGVEGDTVNSYLTDVSMGHAANGNLLFAAHVVGFNPGFGAENEWTGPSAAKFGGGVSVVPVPPAIALMMSGIALLGGMAKRKAGNAQA